MDRLPSCGATTQTLRCHPCHVGESLGQGRGRPQGKKYSGRCRPFVSCCFGLKRHVRPAPPPGLRLPLRDQDSPGAR
jgi:hypothetical protein